MHCAFCNENIEREDMELGEVVCIEGNYWHSDCFTEYFGISPDEALATEEVVEEY